MARKPRLPRVDRTEDMHIDDETAHLWAVSYADFLMVLLSFFILFFSTDEQVKNDIIKKISAQSASLNPGGFTGVPGGGRDIASTPASETAAVLESSALQEIAENLSQTVKAEAHQRKIIFYLGENIYSVGSYNLSKNSKDQYIGVLEVLKPFANEVDITIIGHTDNLKVKQLQPKQFIRNNFDLSVYRATRALEIAMESGIPAQNLSAKGAADFQRNTRSLSLIVTPKITLEK